ncbi:MAG: DUF427 domain-containing protein [Kiloniellales bacterium]|nr:DUF427 domain-containing protein [Kiloniellales bacterium]
MPSTTQSSELAANAPSRASAISPDDYHIEIIPSPKRVKVVFNGFSVADSRRALILRETRYPPIYYLPREDVRMDLLERTTHRTYCPFKGNASYWTLAVGEERAENAAWSYEEPYDEVAEIKDYIAFYWNKVDAWHQEDNVVAMDTSDASSAADGNRLAPWLLREAWHAEQTEELFGRFARCLVEQGIPLWRLNLVMRTLHPQLIGNAYVWRRDRDSVEVRDIPYSSLESSAYLDSPLAPIFEGAGGIRRRLDGPEPELDFPVLKDLHAEGATDYVAMPMLFSDGQINALTLTSDSPQGFSTKDLGEIYELLPVISRLFEVQAMRHTARSLLDTYLGAHSGDRVLKGKIKRGDAEDIPAVIWLSDLRESTAMAESMSREVYLEVLNGFFDASAGAVLEHKGEVLKFIGDAVLAIFPIESGDDSSVRAGARKACERALAAARDLRDRMAKLNAARQEAGESALQCALALHKGRVSYGNVGTPGRLDFTVIGPAINETARLAGLSKKLDRRVLVSESFAHALSQGLITLGRHRLRGVAEQREVFTLADQEA